MSQEKKMSKKMKIIILIIVFFSLYFCFWVTAQIYSHFNPPIAADGSSSAYNYMKYQRDLEKEELER